MNTVLMRLVVPGISEVTITQTAFYDKYRTRCIDESGKILINKTGTLKQCQTILKNYIDDFI